MALNDVFDFLREMLILLPRSFCHVLNVLLFVKRYFERTAIRVHTLQDHPVLHTRLEEGGVQGKSNALLDSLVLNERVDSNFLEVGQAASVADHGLGEGWIRHICQLRRACRLMHAVFGEQCVNRVFIPAFVLKVYLFELKLDLAVRGLERHEGFSGARLDRRD